jgi:hypothetical protein
MRANPARMHPPVVLAPRWCALAWRPQAHVIARTASRWDGRLMTMNPSTPPSEQARIQHISEIEGPGESGGTWSNWVTFAALVLALLGALNGFQGFLALLDDGYFVAPGKELVLVNYDAWGAILILWGIVLLIVAGGLNGRREWARWAAALVVCIDVILQVGFLPSSPLLSVTLIALDVVVLYALTVRWQEAKTGGI